MKLPIDRLIIAHIVLDIFRRNSLESQHGNDRILRYLPAKKKSGDANDKKRWKDQKQAICNKSCHEELVDTMNLASNMQMPILISQLKCIGKITWPFGGGICFQPLVDNDLF